MSFSALSSFNPNLPSMFSSKKNSFCKSSVSKHTAQRVRYVDYYKSYGIKKYYYKMNNINSSSDPSIRETLPDRLRDFWRVIAYLQTLMVLASLQKLKKF